MGKFTALDDPKVDEIVAVHMQRIVASIRSHMEPEAILLRGSFGRGEGSVLVANGKVKFLSDYEINVATYSPLHRKLFSRLAASLSTEFGVVTSLAWIRPDYFYKLRIGPFVAGTPPITIALYETRYGSRILYGQDLLAQGPDIDAHQVSLYSGIRLILNRMAESLQYLPESANAQDEWQCLIWVNKLVLACMESLLLLWGQYHFSYAERGRRFTALANQRLDFMGGMGPILTEWVERAVEFKLRPARNLYPDSLQETWRQVIPMCDRVFRYLICQGWGVSFEGYSDFPEVYLRSVAEKGQTESKPVMFVSKLLDLYKCIRKRCLPRGILLPYSMDQIVYSVVPFLFVGWASPEETLPPLLGEAKRYLAKIHPLNLSSSNPRDEWCRLNDIMFWSWKNFCA